MNDDRCRAVLRPSGCNSVSRSLLHIKHRTFGTGRPQGSKRPDSAARPEGCLADVHTTSCGIAGRPFRCTDAKASLVFSVRALPFPRLVEAVPNSPLPGLPNSNHAAPVLHVLLRRAVANVLASFARARADEALAASPSAVPAP